MLQQPYGFMPASIDKDATTPCSPATIGRKLRPLANLWLALAPPYHPRLMFSIFLKADKMSLGWTGGARAGHRSTGGRSLNLVVLGEQGVVVSLFVVAGIEP